MKKIEEMNSFDDIDNYYEAEIPQFIQEILEERVEALKHCITYKKEIERLNNRLKTSNDTCNYLRNIIDKAIEYMDRRDLEWGSDEHNKMMDILKGSDKE